MYNNYSFLLNIAFLLLFLVLHFCLFVLCITVFPFPVTSTLITKIWFTSLPLIFISTNDISLSFFSALWITMTLNTTNPDYLFLTSLSTFHFSYNLHQIGINNQFQYLLFYFSSSNTTPCPCKDSIVSKIIPYHQLH